MGANPVTIHGGKKGFALLATDSDLMSPSKANPARGTRLSGLFSLAGCLFSTAPRTANPKHPRQHLPARRSAPTRGRQGRPTQRCTPSPSQSDQEGLGLLGFPPPTSCSGPSSVLPQGPRRCSSYPAAGGRGAKAAPARCLSPRGRRGAPLPHPDSMAPLTRQQERLRQALLLL